MLVEEVRFGSGVVIITAIWEMLAPLVLGYSTLVVPTANALIVGLIALVLGVSRYLRPQRWEWMSWVGGALGVWLIVAPFLLSYGNPARVNDVLVGMVMAVGSTWSALASEM
jgi:hypothetical protein